MRIERVHDGFSILLDRGDAQPQWWQVAPRMTLSVERERRIATVTVGDGGPEEGELGNVTLKQAELPDVL